MMRFSQACGLNTCLQQRESDDMADINLQVEVAGLDEALSKARQINDMVKEARTLAGELASELDRLEVKVNDQSTNKIEVEVSGTNIAQDVLSTIRDKQKE